ncbi:MAG: toll/interleukin-1 receptor domain-containing protein [Parvibaculum sp.]
MFFSYSHADEALRDQLEKQLSLLKRQGTIEVWHDRRIGAGADFVQQIDHHIESDDIILLLVSADFLDSDYCYEIEMQRAIERHNAGEAIVIPVILRACEWHGAPFGHLNAVPPDGMPVTQFADRDQGFLEVAKAVRKAAEGLVIQSEKERNVEADHMEIRKPVAVQKEPRSSILALPRKFTQKDKDQFRFETFEYIAKFFENSLVELSRRNEGIETNFRRVDANCFTVVVYRDGRAVSRCSVFVGASGFSNGIAYSSSDDGSRSSYNELLSVGSDDSSLYLQGAGMYIFTGGSNDDRKLTQEGAAELYWEMLLRPLQR